MKIKFLQTTPSGTEGFPFQAGQVIDVAEPTEAQLAWLDGVQAVVVKEDDAPETATVRDPERAVSRGRSKARP
jgi:hypothetical protein